MIDHIITCANYEQHIVKPPVELNENELPAPCSYIATLLTANLLGWKQKGFKWYCPECVKENIEANDGLIENNPDRQI